MNNHFDHGTETCLLFCPSNGRSISPRVSANEKSQSFSAALEPSLSASVVRGNDVVRFHKRHGEDLLRPVHASRKLRFLVQLEVLCYFRLSTAAVVHSSLPLRRCIQLSKRGHGLNMCSKKLHEQAMHLLAVACITKRMVWSMFQPKSTGRWNPGTQQVVPICERPQTRLLSRKILDGSPVPKQPLARFDR